MSITSDGNTVIYGCQNYWTSEHTNHGAIMIYEYDGNDWILKTAGEGKNY